jgi:glyoxylase-like metal-dependent hydrolase (beta-lactamase superfamily II)
MNGLRLSTALAVACLCSSFALGQQQDFSKVQIEVSKVAGNVYMLEGAGGNIAACVGDDGIVIVDDQYAPLAPRIREALRAISTRPLLFVLNTHYHGDHTGGNDTFSADAPIIAQDNVRKRLASGTQALGEKVAPAPPGALPVVTFGDRVSVYANGEEIRAIHFPMGHTDGDSIIYFTKSNVVHMGDDFFNGFFPFVDIDNGGSVRGMLANVDKVLATLPADAKVIPGHGPLGDKKGLQAFADMLRGTIGTVQAAMKSGKTLEQMKSQKVLAAWDAWGKGFVKNDFWIEQIHRELSAPQAKTK